jgi:hypothetical protein
MRYRRPHPAECDPDFWTCPLCGGRHLKGTGSDRCRLSGSKLFECATCRQLVSESALSTASAKRLDRKSPAGKRGQGP